MTCPATFTGVRAPVDRALLLGVEVVQVDVESPIPKNHQDDEEPKAGDVALLAEVLRLIGSVAPVTCKSPETGLVASVVSGLVAAVLTWWSKNR